MITPEFLQSCTDKQINKGVAWLEASKLSYRENTIKNFRCWNGTLFIDFEAGYSPCASPNDAYPIMMDNDIETKRRRGVGDRVEYIAHNGLIRVINKNPLRAAMEVYLRMGNGSV